ncbi:MAG: glycosyltransferase family 39 protein [Phycisphaerae bacterium]
MNRSWVDWVCLAVAGVVLIVFRLHAFDLPLEADECNYACIGGRLLAGDRLYVDVWDHQPFGIFVLFAGLIALFGDAPEVIRWMTIVFSLASLALVFAILRRVSSRGAAITGAILFAIVSSDPGTAGEGCNREIYMVTLVLAAWYFALRCAAAPSWSLFLAGCALALASATKTIVAVHWMFLAPWVVMGAWSGAAPEHRARSAVTSLVLFGAGPAILWVSAFAYFGATGRLGEFIDAVFLFNLSYSGSSEGFPVRFLRFFAPERHPFIIDSALPLWIGGGAATVWLLVEAVVRRRRGGLAVLLLILAGYVAVCLPARFWPHYYYLLIPVLVIAVSMTVGRLATWVRKSAQALSCGSERTTAPRRERVNHHAPSLRLWCASAGILAVFPILLFATEYRDYLNQPPFGITVKRYNSRDFWGRAQGQNVRRVTDHNDEIFVFGNDTEIYYYAQRRCASRYTMITGLQSGFAGSKRRRETLIAELQERLPRLILVLFDERPFDEWKTFLTTYYSEPIGWDYHDRSGKPIMFVLARKDRPVESINWDWDRSAVGGWMLGDKP